MRKGDIAARARGARLGLARGRLGTGGIRTGGRPRLEKHRKRLPEQRMEDYVAVVSHELRTPLTALRLQLDTTLNHARGFLDACAPILPGLEAARRQVERLVTMVDQLLDASRIAGGKLELELEPVDLMAVVRETVSALGEQLGRAGCELEVRGPESVTGSWNRLALEQVVTNLVVNACKYGRGKPIEIVVDADEQRVSLRIKDHGIGIARADQARIFDRYEQVPAARRQGGLGLGLWIVTRIVSALDGCIRVESRPGQGASFIVELSRGRTA